MGIDIKSVVGEQTLGSARDSVLVSLSSKSTVGGMFTSIYGWLTHTESAIFIGIVVTLLGFVMNYIFQRRKSKREAALWEQQIQAHNRAEERKEELHKARLLALNKGAELDSCL